MNIINKDKNSYHIYLNYDSIMEETEYIWNI